MSQRVNNSAATGKRKPWQFLTKFVITNDKGDPYLIRYRIIQTPYASLFLHKILRGDSDPYVHDHPWMFVSFLLRGQYTEVRRDNFTHDLKERTVKWVNVMRRDDAHYILSLLDDKPVWSLLFVGRRRRTWGFWMPYGPALNEDGTDAIVQRQMWIEFENWES